MEFVIERTSDFGTSINQPVEKAFPCEDPYGNPSWHIKFDTLEDLMNFIKEEDCEIIMGSGSYHRDRLPYVEIYDDWRE
jgi:hypothetical protein